MKARYLLGIALAVAASVAACGDGSDDGGLGNYRAPNGGTTTGGAKVPGQTGGGTTDTATAGDKPAAPSDPTATPETAAKKYFKDNVFPTLSTTCGTCHEAGPGPQWINKSDVEVSYKYQFQLGYVSAQSRILLKGSHYNGAAPALTADQQTKFTTWVNMENASGASANKPNPLEKIGACFDLTKFNAMQLGQLRTIRRTTNNNENQVTPWNENDNNCTGCDNTPCRNCHSGDDATGFVMAIGNNLLPQNYTFDQSKSTTPPYIQKYFGVTATGDPVASNAIKIKMDATAKDHAYTHPFFKLSDTQLAAVDAFVQDAITKYKSTNGACP